MSWPLLDGLQWVHRGKSPVWAWPCFLDPLLPRLLVARSALLVFVGCVCPPTPSEALGRWASFVVGGGLIRCMLVKLGVQISGQARRFSLLLLLLVVCGLTVWTRCLPPCWSSQVDD